MREADTRAECHHDASRHRQLTIEEPLDVGLDEADFRSDRPQRQVGCGDELRSVRRVERLARITTVSEHRARKLRQANLRKQTIDEPRFFVLRSPDVEEACALERVRASHRVEVGQTVADLGLNNLASEIETGTKRLLDDAGQENRGRRLEDARLTIRDQRAIFMKTIVADDRLGW